MPVTHQYAWQHKSKGKQARIVKRIWKDHLTLLVMNLYNEALGHFSVWNLKSYMTLTSPYSVCCHFNLPRGSKLMESDFSFTSCIKAFQNLNIFVPQVPSQSKSLHFPDKSAIWNRILRVYHLSYDRESGCVAKYSTDIENGYHITNSAYLLHNCHRIHCKGNKMITIYTA